jgi:hypothetical protein
MNMSVDAQWDLAPFPHTVVKDLWDPEVLRRVREEFPDPDDPRWITYPAPEERGKRAGAENCWGPQTSAFIEQLRSQVMCDWLTMITDIGPLTPDTIGGGMHMTTMGGRLERHVDFNVHPSLPLERRLNVLVFLEDDWDPAWGGMLELGEVGDPTGCAVAPVLNTTVVFECSDHSWHGHPVPIAHPSVRRRSIAVYYYAPLREETGEAHTTIWKPE